MITAVDCIAPLFVPASRPERFDTTAASGTDAVIIDLEDALEETAKHAARANLRADLGRCAAILRINGVGTPWHAEDLAAACRLAFAAIMIPKAEAGAAFDAACALAAAADKPVIALIESARGLVDARAIAALPGVARLCFGSIDYCADMDCAHTRDALQAARAELLLASRLAGLLAPIDGVTTSIDDSNEITGDARHARELGFGGKLCIHPRQVELVLAGFRPIESEITWARKVLASGEGAVAVDGSMVDEPVRARARAILRRAASTPN